MQRIIVHPVDKSVAVAGKCTHRTRTRLVNLVHCRPLRRNVLLAADYRSSADKSVAADGRFTYRARKRPAELVPPALPCRSDFSCGGLPFVQQIKVSRRPESARIAHGQSRALPPRRNVFACGGLSIVPQLRASQMPEGSRTAHASGWPISCALPAVPKCFCVQRIIARPQMRASQLPECSRIAHASGWPISSPSSAPKCFCFRRIIIRTADKSVAAAGKCTHHACNRLANLVHCLLPFAGAILLAADYRSSRR